ncbi:MAG: lactate dehydrogenase/glycoside hydrolase [Podila humilis]|nr:MAG: lactate dehydrogenase/glycoside hydrolase [Podila humilis]
MHTSTPTLLNSPRQVAIIGAGMVGSAVAFACLNRSVVSELLVNDINKIGLGQVLDLEDAAFFSSAKVRHASLQDCGQADIIVMTAGYNNGPGESRDTLIHRNELILKDVLGRMQPIKSSAIFIMVANPVNILTYMAQKLTGLPPSQVFGSGTYLDTIRLRNTIRKTLDVSDASIQAYVIGDHGDQQVALWSSATVGGQPLLSFPEFEHMNTSKIAHQCSRKVYSIIEYKGGSSFGIGSIISEVIECINLNKKSVIPLTVYSERYDVCLSLPVVLGINGIDRIIYPQMDSAEEAALGAYIKSNQAFCINYRQANSAQGPTLVEKSPSLQLISSPVDNIPDSPPSLKKASSFSLLRTSVEPSPSETQRVSALKKPSPFRLFKSPVFRFVRSNKKGSTTAESDMMSSSSEKQPYSAIESSSDSLTVLSPVNVGLC